LVAVVVKRVTARSNSNAGLTVMFWVTKGSKSREYNHNVYTVREA